MMVHKDRRGGTLILDVRVRGVGRIKRASGTTDAKVLRHMKRDIEDLANDGRLDILRALRDGALTPMVLRDAVRRRAVDRLALGAVALPLSETWESWVERKICSAAHKRSLAQSLRHLKATDHATVGDVATLLEEARERLSQTPQSFRLCRAACQAFLKATLKRSHPLYADVSAVEPLAVTPKRHKHPATPDELRRIARRAVGAGVAEVIFTAALTGMRMNELWGDWERLADRVVIHGTKTRGADRVVPLVSVLLFRPTMSYKAFRLALGKASDGQMTPYDLRRTYANWLEAAGIPRTRRRLYLGHGNADVTDLYEWHQIEQFLAEDAAKLRAFLDSSHEKSHELRLEKA